MGLQQFFKRDTLYLKYVCAKFMNYFKEGIVVNWACNAKNHSWSTSPCALVTHKGSKAFVGGSMGGVAQYVHFVKILC